MVKERKKFEEKWEHEILKNRNLTGEGLTFLNVPWKNRECLVIALLYELIDWGVTCCDYAFLLSELERQ